MDTRNIIARASGVVALAETLHHDLENLCEGEHAPRWQALAGLLAREADVVSSKINEIVLELEEKDTAATDSSEEDLAETFDEWMNKRETQRREY